ncbi:MAG TPA: SDR family NAD(P)-dependent oxidoreductase [Vicinamibacterales bacterium]|nr:SDR family NAD(P)-dependent oxidoreductase [Vicinamibacterales bacterium]
MSSIRFTNEDVALFSEASHDRNPLHLSGAYARKSPFGQPVIFGALAALGGIGRLDPRPDSGPARIDIEFQNPVFPDVEYDLSVQDDPDTSRVRLSDGRRPLVTASITYRPAVHGSMTSRVRAALLPAAQLREASDFSKGRAVTGTWAFDRDAYDRLRDRWQLQEKGGDERHQAALLLASYVVGMEMPGRQALFSRLTLDFDPGAVSTGGEFEYRLEVVLYQPVVKLLIMRVEFRLGAQRFASGEIRAFVREPIEMSDADAEALPAGDALQGKVACVVGGSRGLGAAISAALARQGCRVHVNFAKSLEEAERLRDRLRGASGEIILAQGDAADADSWQRIREDVVRDRGRLDMLVCNACPPLLPLWVEPQAVPRIQEHVSQSVAVTLTPLAALVELLAESSGWLVLISSVAVRNPVAEWPHYVAAKGALEALVSTVAIEYPQIKCLIARPSRLVTELTNTPLGRKGAIDPGVAAATLVQWVLTPRDVAAGRVAYLDF